MNMGAWLSLRIAIASLDLLSEFVFLNFLMV